MSLIHIEHLRKVYPNVTPLQDVCAEINAGDVIAIIGPSGTGKSTLLRCLNRLEEPTSGTVTLDGEVITDPKCDITGVRRRMGMVFQSFNLFNNLNVLDNVIAAPMKLLKKPRNQAVEEGMALLERVGLRDKADDFPEALSGGQKQRVAIARAIAMKPQILMFDEPTSALDPTMAGEVLAVIRSLAREDMTLLIVTHQMQFAREIANRVFYMDEGGIYEEGTPEQIFGHPRLDKTRQFIRRLRTLEVEIDPADADWPGTLQRLMRFGSEAMLDRSTLHNVTLTFEELVFQCVLPKLRETGSNQSVRARVEHSDVDGGTAMEFTWSGPRLDPLANGDALSVALVKKLAERCEYSYDSDNHVSVLFADSINNTGSEAL